MIFQRAIVHCIFETALAASKSLNSFALALCSLGDCSLLRKRVSWLWSPCGQSANTISICCDFIIPLAIRAFSRFVAMESCARGGSAVELQRNKYLVRRIIIGNGFVAQKQNRREISVIRPQEGASYGSNAALLLRSNSLPSTSCRLWATIISPRIIPKKPCPMPQRSVPRNTTCHHRSRSCLQLVVAFRRLHSPPDR